MVRQVTGELLAVAAGATIAAYCFSGPEKVHPQEDGFSVNVNPELREAFTQVENYWEYTRGLGKLGIKLVFIEKGEEFTCAEQSVNIPIKSDFDSSGIYCEGNKVIAIAATTWESERKQTMESGGNPLDYSRLLLGHEYGHGLQQFNDAKLRQKGVGASALSIAAIEQQADCLDGIVMQETHIATISKAAWFNMIGDTPDTSSSPDAHGTKKERENAYLSGQSASGNASNCGLTALPHTSN